MVDVNVDFIFENAQPINADFQLEPDVTYTADILLSSASSFHNELYNRDLPDQHPMGAITGLEDALEGLSDDITAENNRAIEAEEALDNKIDSEADTRADEITRVEGLISDEEARASGAEATLHANITDEENRAKGVEQQLTSSIDSNHQAISNHVSDKNNPHEVTKAQVGLGDVENIAPADMPMSTATKTYVDNADNGLQGQITSINTTIGGYGNIVTHNVSEFATASQGDLADTSLQPNDNISELVNNLNYQTATQVANSIAVETSNRESADNNLQSQIDAIVSSSDVFDIVGTYAELQAYDISTVPVNDIIKVLEDSTHAGAATYYRCIETNNVKSWSYIGSEGASYTKAESDNRFVPQTRTVNNKALSSDITLTATDVGALPSSTVIPTVNDATVTIQKNGSTVSTFTLNQSSNETVNITVPTKTSEITNDSGYITSASLPTVNNGQLDIQVNGSSIATFTANQSGNTTANVVVPDSATWGNITGTLSNQTDLQTALNGKYDASNPNGYITGISSSDVTTALGYTPYNSSNPAGYITSSALAPYALSSSLSAVATSGAYADLSGKPTIPTVNNPTITITQGGTTKGSFTLNQSSGATIALDAGGAGGIQNTATGTDSLTILGNPASDDSFINIGTDSGINSTAEEEETPCPSSIAIGAQDDSLQGAKVGGQCAIAIGTGAESQELAVSMGYNAVSGTEAVAVGGGSSASNNGVAVGSGASASGASAVAIGTSSNALSSNSISIGNNSLSQVNRYATNGIGINGKVTGTTRARADNSIGIGGNVTNVQNAIQLGSGTNTTANSLQVGNHQLFDISTGLIPIGRVLNLLEAIYPVGSVYIGTQATCPMSTVMSGTTWTLVSSGKALWTGNGSNGNTTINAGLPNITGNIENSGNAGGFTEGSGTGCFTDTTNYAKMKTHTSSNSSYDTVANKLVFNASLSNSIYGNSTTVQPPAYVVNVWRRTA